MKPFRFKYKPKSDYSCDCINPDKGIKINIVVDRKRASKGYTWNNGNIWTI